MNLIATINGVNIYSDKKMSSIKNGRIIFTDGSWCDAHTGEVHNVGPGYIKIGGTDSSTDSNLVTIGPRLFAALALEVNGISADVMVEPHTGVDMELTVTGPADQVKAIRAGVQGNTLVIDDFAPNTSGGDGVSIIQTVNSSTFDIDRLFDDGPAFMRNALRFGRMVAALSGVGGSESAVKVTIKVPLGAAVEANNVRGNVHIGDTIGPLVASVQGHDVHAGSVSSGTLTVVGSGSIHVKKVNGSVEALGLGTGNIEVQQGSMPTLKVNLMSSGDINVRGIATTANLTLMGTGDIKVEHVLNRPKKSQMGTGDIRVGRIG